MCDIQQIKRKFQKRKGFFNQVYYSLRLSNFEITVDNQMPEDRYIVCLCSPYNEKADQINKHNGYGGGEVKKDWEFEEEKDAFKFVAGLL
jgi:hypothetical protein